MKHLKSQEAGKSGVQKKSLGDMGVKQATAEQLANINGADSEVQSSDKVLGSRQKELLNKADGLLKRRNEKKAVTASVSGLSNTLKELERVKATDSEAVLNVLKGMDFPPELKCHNCC